MEQKVNKILFLGMGSANDPGFEDVKIDGKQYRDYMKEKGIVVLGPFIESCHGCPDFVKSYSNQLQSLINRTYGIDKVVGVLQGGLLFALPSIQATQTTFPIISVPLDEIAYTAFMVPTGHAVVAGVGVERKVSGVYTTDARRAALLAAEKILNLEDTVVKTIPSILPECPYEEKIAARLSELSIDSKSFYIHEDDGKRNLVIAPNDEDMLKFIKGDSLIIRYLEGDFEFSRPSGSDAEHLRNFGTCHLFVRGAENAAIFATKIVSMYRKETDIIERIVEIGIKKQETYGREPKDIHFIELPAALKKLGGPNANQ